MSVHLTPGHTLRRLLQSQIYHSGRAWPVKHSDVTVRELCNVWVCFVFLFGFGGGFGGGGTMSDRSGELMAFEGYNNFIVSFGSVEEI